MADSFAGLDLLATAVVVLDEEFTVRYANPAAENLLTAGARSLLGQPFLGFFAERTELERSLEEARVIHWDYSARNVTYVRTGRAPVPLSCTVTRIDSFGMALLAELRPISDQLRIEREARIESLRPWLASNRGSSIIGLSVGRERGALEQYDAPA